MPFRRAINAAIGKIRRAPLVNNVVKWVQSAFPPSICFVSATRLPEADFWAGSPLGTTLKPLLGKQVTYLIRYENTDGLPALYNQAITERKSDILVFVHDDVWLDDPQLLKKMVDGLNHFDVIGVAGNRRISKRQPAWLFSQIVYGKFIRDTEYLSGSVIHGEPPENTNKVTFGEMPAPCELLDGVLLAGWRAPLLRARVHFDNTFKFDFYDMDFCRSARQAHLTLGTWPIDIIHRSRGKFGTERWQESYEAYLAKWKQ